MVELYILRTLFGFFNTSGYNNTLQVLKLSRVVVKTEVDIL